jgi:hypothetical protein
MKKIAILILIVGTLIISLYFITNLDENNSAGFAKIRIAACPTSYESAKSLDSEKYELISTMSTAESLALWKSGRADLVLAGRALKPGEPDMGHAVLSDGYSFLGAREMTVYAHELNNYEIYTDLNIEKLKNELSISKINRVNDVYEFLEKGIVITSWENTDFYRANIVHILERGGERLELSRRQTLYCPNFCEKNILDDLSFAISENVR